MENTVENDIQNYGKRSKDETMASNSLNPIPEEGKDDALKPEQTMNTKQKTGGEGKQLQSNSEKDPIVDVDGNKYQKITRIKSFTFNAEEVIASTILADFEGQTLYAYGYFQHDGYPVSTGDKLTTIWTFLRPVL